MSASFTSVASAPVKVVKQGDPEFTFSTGLTFCSRAGIEIDSSCPTGYREIIATAVSRGWVKPFAVLKEHEYMWQTLGD